MQHLYLSDRLFVALVKRLGVPRRRLRTLRSLQRQHIADGTTISLFSTARLEGLLDDAGAERLLAYARRAIRRHPEYRDDLITVDTQRARRRRAKKKSELSLDAQADQAARSVEDLFALPQAPLGYQAEPLAAAPIAGSPVVDLASLLTGPPAPPPQVEELRADDSPFGLETHNEFDSGSGFGVHSEAGFFPGPSATPDFVEDSSLFAVVDWSAPETDPFATASPAAAPSDPFSAEGFSDPFAAAAESFSDSFATSTPSAFFPESAPATADPFAASAGTFGYEDPFAAAARGSAGEDPFAAAARGSAGEDPFAAAASQPPANWLGRSSAEFDPFGPPLGRRAG